MKKIFFFLTALFALAVCGNAQNISPYWSLAGNNNATNTSKLGTTNAINLSFFTNNLERARITTSGEVGIGTTNPLTKFHVNGSGSFGGNVTNLNATRAFNLVDVNAVMRILRVHATNAPAVELISRKTANGDNVAYWDLYAEPTDASFRIRDRQSGNIDRLTILHTTGNVGIGTTGPFYKLHVEATGTAVYGNSTGGFYGVYGASTYTGVYGSGTSYGVIGNGRYGVYGVGSSYGVYGSGGTYGVYGSGTSYGVYGTSTDGYGVNAISTNSYGLYASTTSSWGSVAYGGYGGSYGSGDTYGVYGNTGTGSGVRGISTSGYGVYGSSNYIGVWGVGDYGLYGSGGRYGIWANGTTYGVYGESTDGNGGRFYSANGYGLYAITGRADNNWAGVFDGDVYCYNNYETSDKNLKKNIKEFGDAMTIINKLKPKNYEFITEGKLASLNLPRGHHYGLIAQDVELVLPNLVKESVHDLNFAKSKAIKPSADGKVAIAIRNEPSAAIQKDSSAAIQKDQTEAVENITLKAVNYTELIPIIVKGMQELYADKDKKINDLQQQIDELKIMIQNLSKQGGHPTGLSSAAFLKQNSPNPFNNNTIISYYIPDNSGYAQIKLTDIKGSVIKTFNAAKGEGQINIRSGELPSGTYNYTLYINNKTVDTKQMVLLK